MALRWSCSFSLADRRFRFGIPTMYLKHFQRADTAAIVQLFQQTIHQINSRDYTREQVNAWAPANMDHERWTARLEKAFTLVAVNKHEVVGFAMLESNGHIDCFYTHAHYQGQGIGKRMLEALETRAREQGVTRLFTEASITARPFFASKGYTTLQEQQVLCRGVYFTNFRMEKELV
jgi:putative acetyltransferase